MDRALIQESIRKAYTLVLDNNYIMPDRVHVKDGENTLLLMPCFSGTYFATKLVSVFPGAAKAGLPVVNGVMTLNDNNTGQPLAVMDGAALTAERTGAVGGMGVAVLCSQNLERAGVFGAGVQGYSQVRYLILNRRVKEVRLMDLNPDAVDRMIQSLSQEFPDVHFMAADSPEDLVAQSQLIVSATTTKTPLFADDPTLVTGKTFISIGSFLPDMKEFPNAVIESADGVYVDSPFAAEESGDICQPLEQGRIAKEAILPFAPLVKTPVALADAHGKSKTFFYKSTGMALFDLTAASAVYEAAREQTLGTVLDFG